MALNYVTLTVDEFDGSGNLPTSGSVTFTPSAVLSDKTNGQYVDQEPVVAYFTPGLAASPTVRLLATDNPTLLPSGWGWQVAFQGINRPTGWTFFLPFSSGATQKLSAQVLVPTTATALLDEAGQALLAEG